MTIEDELREALAAEAEQVSPAPDAWRRVAENAAVGERQRRRRVWVGSGLVATGLAAVMAFAAVGTMRDDDEVPLQVVDPPTTDTAPAPLGAPPSFIGYRSNGQIVEVSTQGGAERVIATAKYSPEANPRIGHVEAGANTVYYDAEDGLWEVPRQGGRPKRIGPGRLPALSPDGTILAYAQSRGGEGDVLVLREVSTGRERTLGRTNRPADTFSNLSWDGSSSELYVFWRWEDAEGLLELDLAKVSTSLDEGAEVGDPETPDRDDGFSYEHYFESNVHVAVHRCCRVESAEGVYREWNESYHRLAFLTEEGVFRNDALDLGDKAVTSLLVSRHGQRPYVTYVLEDRELWGWSGGVNDRPVRLGEGYLSAVL